MFELAKDGKRATEEQGDVIGILKHIKTRALSAVDTLAAVSLFGLC